MPANVEVPDVTLHALFQKVTQEYGAGIAALFYGEKLTYTQLGDQAARFASALSNLGLAKGDRVALLLPNSPQFVLALFGTLMAGGVAMPLNPALTTLEVAEALAGARFVVALQAQAGRVREVCASPDLGVEHLIVTGLQDFLSPLMSLMLLMRERREVSTAQPQPQDEPGGVATHYFLDLLRQNPHTSDAVQVEPGETALILYTEGVTDKPKRVELSHNNLVANISQVSAWIWDSRPERREVYLAAIPFHTGYGLVAALGLPLSVAATIALLPRPTPKELVRAIARCRPTVFPAMPSLLSGLLSHQLAQRLDLRSIRVCLSSGDRLTPGTARAVEELTGARVVEAYGLTEATALTHCNPVYGERREGSIGLPLPLTDARILDPEGGNELLLGEVGELAVAGPQVPLGRGNADGWLLTGDAAWQDEEGYFYVAGRRDDVITLRENVIYPTEIENVLLQNEKVEECLALGVPNPRTGQPTITAYVVLKDDAEATDHELIRFCADRLPEHAVPTRIEFREDLPVSALGKYLRKEVVSG